jgi:structural maintenance of chromosomes protein 5
LQFLQVEANKKALEELCKRKDEKYSLAVTKFNEGRLVVYRYRQVRANCFVAVEVYKKLKEESTQALEVSRAKIEEANDEIRAEYYKIESARVQYDNDLKVAMENGTAPPDKTGVELRDPETLQADLDAAKHNLELHVNTNPGVIEQYETRKRDVSKD